MPISGPFENEDRLIRYTNDSKRRVTSDSSIRMIGAPNSGVSMVAATADVFAFAGDLQVKNSGTWQVPETWVRDGETWKQAATAYCNDNGIWKRIL